MQTIRQKAFPGFEPRFDAMRANATGREQSQNT
jgi:hypothetical protein